MMRANLTSSTLRQVTTWCSCAGFVSCDVAAKRQNAQGRFAKLLRCRLLLGVKGASTKAIVLFAVIGTPAPGAVLMVLPTGTEENMG